MSSMTALAASELKLYVREWGTLVFAFVFPPLMMMILAGVFAGDDPEAFGVVDGSDHYIVSYLAVPMAAVALTTLPVMMAGYAEAGVLKRFNASGVTALRVVVAQAFTCLVGVLAGAALVLAVAAPTYGIPPLQQPLAVLAVVAVGAAAMLTIGVALGLLVRSVRVANALGLTLFFPMFILGGGGPPEAVMTPAMRSIADVLPLSHLTAGVREAWLLGGYPASELWWLLGWWTLAGLAVAVAVRWRRGRAA
jgi:ABC-2 type transport system permease protein